MLPASQWLGYAPPADTPPPLHPTEWGAMAPLPPLLAQAANASRIGDLARAQALLEQDPNDPLARALASLGRTMKAQAPHAFSGVPN